VAVCQLPQNSVVQLGSAHDHRITQRARNFAVSVSYGTSSPSAVCLSSCSLLSTSISLPQHSGGACALSHVHRQSSRSCPLQLRKACPETDGQRRPARNVLMPMVPRQNHRHHRLGLLSARNFTTYRPQLRLQHPASWMPRIRCWSDTATDSGYLALFGCTAG
jgi:hypothetical protein